MPSVSSGKKIRSRRLALANQTDSHPFFNKWRINNSWRRSYAFPRNFFRMALRSSSVSPGNASRKSCLRATPRLINSALKWSSNSTFTFRTQEISVTASRISLAMRNAKFGAHQYVGNLNSIRTSFPCWICTEVTNSREITDSSSSGSVTVSSADQTSCVRLPLAIDFRLGLRRDRHCLSFSRDREAELLASFGDINAIQPSSVLSHDLSSDVESKSLACFRRYILRQLKIHQLLHNPLRAPDRVITAIQNAVGPQPK